MTAQITALGLSVYGKGLRVTNVGAHVKGHGTGVRARLITYTPKGYRSELTGWKGTVNGEPCAVIHR